MGERLFKYHGLGNDFVVIDRRQSGADISAAQAIGLCDRHRGIGADGVLVLLPAQGAAARMVVHNADGSVAGMCGNGIRCVVKHLLDGAPASGTEVVVETAAGRLRCKATLGADGKVAEVEVSMGKPQVGFVAQSIPEARGLTATAVSMGNPHLVFFDGALGDAVELGPKLERHRSFPDRTNVEFVQQLGPQRLRIAVWERGVGLTQACGTGACASAVAGVVEKRMPAGEWIDAELPGGTLGVCVSSDLSDVRMRGPAAFVFWGEWP